MAYPLKDRLFAAFGPLATIRHGLHHYKRIVEDDFERRCITRTKFAAEGALSVSSYLLAASLLPFFDQDLKKTMVMAGQLGMTLGFTYSVPLAYDLWRCGRADLERQDKLRALTGRRPTGP